MIEFEKLNFFGDYEGGALVRKGFLFIKVRLIDSLINFKGVISS
jgi:hypothetical protein